VNHRAELDTKKVCLMTHDATSKLHKAREEYPFSADLSSPRICVVWVDVINNMKIHNSRRRKNTRYLSRRSSFGTLSYNPYKFQNSTKQTQLNSNK
jgi:hypothetical protein